VYYLQLRKTAAFTCLSSPLFKNIPHLRAQEAMARGSMTVPERFCLIYSKWMVYIAAD